MGNTKIFNSLSFPNKVKEILHSFESHVLGGHDGLVGLDTIEAVNKILEIIDYDLIGYDELSSDEKNTLRAKQREILNQPKGETS